MAAVPVTISGVLYDKVGRTVQNVTLIGLASLTDVKVDGGPIIPPTPPGTPPGDLGIWQDPGGYNPNAPGQPWPPETPPTTSPIEWHAAWSEQTGWIIVGTPTGAHPTPSRK